MFITLNIGHKHIKISAFKSLNIADFVKEETFLSRDFQKFYFAVKRLANVITDICNGEEVSGIGISITAGVNPKTGVFSDPESFAHWSGYSLTKELYKYFDCPIVIENDSVVSNLAEVVATENKNTVTAFVFFANEGGIGSSVIKPFQENLLVFPIEIGHIVVVPDGEVCDCGQRGCLSSYASGFGLKKIYGLSQKEITDEESIIVTSRYLTQALMSLLIFYQVDVLIFGAENPADQNIYLEKLIVHVSEMLKRKFDYKVPEIKLSKINNLRVELGCLELMKGSKLINMSHLN